MSLPNSVTARDRTSSVWKTVVLLFLFGCSSKDPVVHLIRLTAEEPVDYLAPDSSWVMEPMVIEHPDRTLYVCGYNGKAPQAFRSQDRGHLWEKLDVGTEEQGAIGGSDCDLAVGPDGSVYLATMEFSQGMGTGIALGSLLAGEHEWKWSAISTEKGADRPWVGVAPDGIVHVAWNRGQDRDSTSSRGVLYTKSKDRGLSWEPEKVIYDHGASSHLAVGPNGELAVRIIPHIWERRPRIFDGDFIAISLDQGETWDLKSPPRVHNWEAEAYFDEVPRWVEPLAWDTEGVLYHLWSEITSLHLGRSDDQGETWSTSMLVSAPDTLFFPYLVAGAPGELAAIYHNGWGLRMAVDVIYIRLHPVTGEISGTQHVQLPYDSLGPWGAGGSDSRNELGEYKPVVLLRDGDLGAVTPIFNLFEHRIGFRWHRIRVSQ